MFYLWDFRFFCLIWANIGIKKFIFCLIWANIGIKKLNVFAMAVMFVTTSALVIHDFGNVFFSCIHNAFVLYVCFC